MTSKHFLLPWQKERIIECPKCGGKISTSPLWPWQIKDEQALQELQRLFGHVIDLELLKRIHVFSDNDLDSFNRWRDFKLEIDPEGSATAAELLREKDGLMRVWRYGVFSLINFLTKKEFETLLLLMSLPPLHVWPTSQICQRMNISHAYLSNIFREFKKWGLILPYPGKLAPEVKGRRKGRKMFYRLSPSARIILDRDLQRYDFFKEAVVETIKSLRERFPTDVFRNDLEAQNPESES